MKTRSGTSLTYRRLVFAVAATLAGTAAQAAPTVWVNTRTQAALPTATAANDLSASRSAQPRLGAVPTSLRTELLKASQQAYRLADDTPQSVAVTLQLRNKAELDRRVEDLITPGRPGYGKTVSSQEFLSRYAPEQKDIDTVVAHLRQAGFSHIQVSANHQLIDADGTVGAIRAAFNTQIKAFPWRSGTAYANDAPAQVPQPLAGIVGSVLGLENVADLQTHAIVADAVSTTTPPSQVDPVPVDPAALPSLYAADKVSTASNTIVGIITFGDLAQTITDLNVFTDQHQFPRAATKIVNIDSWLDKLLNLGINLLLGSSMSDLGLEWNLDSQSIVGAAGGQVKQLVFYNAGLYNLTSSATSPSKTRGIVGLLNRAVSDNQAKVVSGSIGLDEQQLSTLGLDPTLADPILEQGVAQGQTFVFSSGDGGVYAKDKGKFLSADGVTPLAGVALDDYRVDYPASSPYVVAVGGTTLYSADGKTYLDEDVWNSGLYGYDSSDKPISRGLSSDSRIAYYSLAATGGGISKSEPAPSWQAKLTPASGYRQLPDISFDASPQSGAELAYQGKPYNASLKTGVVIGGTSFAAPTFAGFFARVQSAHANRAVFPAPLFYQYGPTDGSWVNDVTVGNNGYGAYPGYAAKPGYDNSTGWGSLKVAAFSDLVGKALGSP